jgi:hypothetical protein
MTHYIYIARKNSYNEGQGYKSLEFVTSTESWEDAYKVMVEEGNKLQAQGWSEGSKSRSKDYCNDVWLEPDYGQKWQDWHEVEIICSTSPLELANND